ncbi:MAG: hypothetical protein WC595_00645 [Candidatus Nanoarchaeia archaeon]
MPKKHPSRSKLKETALDKVKTLFTEAAKRPAKANRYVELARTIAMKINLKIPRELKIKYCKHCNTYFKQDNYRVRTKDGWIIYTCFSCKKYSKYKI